MILAEYIAAMTDNGFPRKHFLPADTICLRPWVIRINNKYIELNEYAREWLTNNNIDVIGIAYEDVYQISSSYIEEKVPAEYFDEDYNEPCWSWETYDMWNEVFITLTEVLCLEAFKRNPDDFLSKVYNKLNQNG